MIRRLCTALLLLLPLWAHAALTSAQLATLKAAIEAETDPAFVGYRTEGSMSSMSAWFNAPPPVPFVVWKSSVKIGDVGKAFNGSELAGLSSLNNTRLQTLGLYFAAGVNPSQTDVRAFFDDIFSGAGGALTRANLLALWKRQASRAEKLFATGTGTDAAPATLTFEGTLTSQDIIEALRS